MMLLVASCSIREVLDSAEGLTDERSLPAEKWTSVLVQKLLE
jgi:hypothetical protein